MSFKKFSLCVLSIPLLSACLGGSGSEELLVLPPEEQAARLFASNGTGATVDLGGFVTDGETVTARSATTAGINLFTQSTATELTNPTVAIRLNASGNLDVLLDGEVLSFADEDRLVIDGEIVGYTKANADSEIVFRTIDRPIDDYLNIGGGYVGLARVQFAPDFENVDSREWAYVAFGAETRDDAIASLGSTEYSGISGFDIFPQQNFDLVGTDRTRVRGDLTLTVDFADADLVGQMTNLSVESPGESFVDVAGMIDFENSEMTGNQISGDLNSSIDFETASGIILESGSTFSGAFYGPNGEAVAGTVVVIGSVDGELSHGIGFFGGDELN